MGPPKHSQGTTQVSKKLNWKIANHSKFHYANSRRKNECGDWIRWSDDAHHAVRPCQVDCHKDWQPQWESGFAYVCIYIHMHNVHNKSAPCLFQIVTAFSKSAKHFGKERKKQHINNIHYEGPPPQFKFRNRETWASQKFEPCPAANPASVVDIYIIYDIIYLYLYLHLHLHLYLYLYLYLYRYVYNKWSQYKINKSE